MLRQSTNTSRTGILPASRAKILRQMLSELRDQEIRRLKELVRNEAGQEAWVPGDESDNARQQGDMELHVSLIGLAESRLAAICAALDRLEESCYGICEECGEEISFERLRAMPMALHCVDCQANCEAASHGRTAGRGVFQDLVMPSERVNAGDSKHDAHKDRMEVKDSGPRQRSRGQRR